MGIHFSHPYFLVLLILPIFAFWWSRKLKSLPKIRRRMVKTLRIIILILIILALAGIESYRISDELIVYFLLDDSRSVSQDGRIWAEKFITESLEESGPKDKAGVIVFGGEPSIEFAPLENLQIAQMRSIVNTDITNIASALRLAMAAFPQHVQKRIVLLSDGNENAGYSLEVARTAKSYNVEINTVPLPTFSANDVMVSKVVVPPNVNVDAPFDLRVFLTAEQSTTATLTILENGTVKIRQNVFVEGNGKKNAFILPYSITSQGSFNYQVIVESPDDIRPENNQGFGFTHVAGQPKVLYVEGDIREQNYLAPALMAENIAVDVVTAGNMPTSLNQIQEYDAIILSNVGADEMSLEQMQLLENAVHNLGIGFVMVGGENSFGAGGFQGSPIEKVLPVDMELKQRKVLPNGAMVIVMHTCEAPSGNTWMRQITLASLKVLSSEDYFGVVDYGSFQGGVAWSVNLDKAANKNEIAKMIYAATPGDMPDFDSALKLAYTGLMKVDTHVKHIVVISDGDPQPPSKILAQKIQNAGITISTVCIFPHAPQNAKAMGALANWGGGNYYEFSSTSNLSNLPRIFVKEASIIRKSLIVEKPFTPAVNQYSEILSGFEAGGYPELMGYIATEPKPLANLPLVTTDKSPLFAHWYYGLGKSVAFTSDAKNKWAANWVSWNQFAKFWAQTVRWVMRSTSEENYQISMDYEGDQGKIIIDAIDEDGQFMNYIKFAGSVVNPDYTSQPITLKQIAPGRYQGNFDIGKSGVYMLGMNAQQPGEAPALVRSGMAISYSPEFKRLRTNEHLLERIAEAGNGRILTVPTSLFEHNLEAGKLSKSLWQFFILLSVLLFPLDIFLRRVMISFRDVWEGMAAAATFTKQHVRFRRKPAIAETSEIEHLKQIKERVPHHKESKERKKQMIQHLDTQAETRTITDAELFDTKKIKPPKIDKEIEQKPEEKVEPDDSFTGKLLKAKKDLKDKIDK